MSRRFIAKVFRTGGSQALRLPKECQVSGTEVSVTKEQGRLVIEPLNRRGWNREFLEMIATPAGVRFPEREQPPMQDRDFDL